MFGAEAGGTKGLVVGLSHFLPGGGAGPDASPPEKVYPVLSGILANLKDLGDDQSARWPSAASCRSPRCPAASSGCA